MRYVAPSIELADQLPVAEGELLARGRRRTGCPRDRHSRVWRSIASGSLAPMRTRSSPPTRLAIGPSSICAGLAHRAGVERRDLGHVVVGRADEPGGVPRLGVEHGLAVDAVPLEPAPVDVEVLPDRADEDGSLAEVRHPEGDVRRDPAPADLEVLGEERQRDLVELLDDEGVREPAPERHEVVGRDGAGEGDVHGRNLSRASVAASWAVCFGSGPAYRRCMATPTPEPDPGPLGRPRLRRALPSSSGTASRSRTRGRPRDASPSRRGPAGTPGPTSPTRHRHWWRIWTRSAPDVTPQTAAPCPGTAVRRVGSSARRPPPPGCTRTGAASTLRPSVRGSAEGVAAGAGTRPRWGCRS